MFRYLGLASPLGVQEKQAHVQNNNFMVVALKIAQCSIWCFERCLKLLNRNATSQIARLGKRCCAIAMSALSLFLRSVRNFGASHVRNAIAYCIDLLSSGTGAIANVPVRHWKLMPSDLTFQMPE